MKQIVDRAHTHGIRPIAVRSRRSWAPSYASDEGEAMREAVNAFMRAPGNFDAVVDFDKVTQDPANPKQFNRASTIPITCIPTTPATRRWPMR